MRLSIITIAYNNLEGLKRTAESIISQTYYDFEWIVIDGGSKDGSKEYLQSIAKHLSFWISEPDKGIYDAMNKGIKQASGEWCIFMNSGDYFYSPTVLDDVFKNMPEGDIVYCDAIYKMEKNDLSMVFPDKLDLVFFSSRCICHQSTFIKTALLHESNGYSTDYKIVSDWRAWVIWIMQGRKFVHLPITVCNFMLDGIGSTRLEEAKKERDRVFQEVLPQYVVDIMNSIDYEYIESLEHHVYKLHEQFANKPLIRASLMINPHNKIIRRLMRSSIHFIYFINRIIFRGQIFDSISDSLYDANNPMSFKFKYK